MGSKARPVPDSRAQAFLKSSESFLDKQNYEECRKHALQAQESDPNHPGPGQLIAIADVISAFSATISSGAGEGSNKKSDYYAILGVPRFTADRQLIKSNFEKLALLLNPNENPYDLSKQAHGLVTKAWRVLSDPDRKSQYDLELGIKLNGGNGSGIRAFWTVCTYCYYLYEFPEEYKKYCIQCQNAKCRRAFNPAVCPPPPPEVIDKGEYDCLEVMSFEGIIFTNGDYGKAQRIDSNDEKFVGMKKQKMAAKSSKKLMGKGVRVKDPVVQWYQVELSHGRSWASSLSGCLSVLLHYSALQWVVYCEHHSTHFIFSPPTAPGVSAHYGTESEGEAIAANT